MKKKPSNLQLLAPIALAIVALEIVGLPPENALKAASISEVNYAPKNPSMAFTKMIALVLVYRGLLTL